MSFLHDVIKIQFINIGYLPNTPYHLISDKEMFKAFYNRDAYVEGSTTSCFFKDFYYYPEDWVKYSDILPAAYEELRLKIEEIVYKYIEADQPVPNWVYSYMLMRPITFESDELDIAYLHNLLDEYFEEPEELKVAGEYLFTEEMAYRCYIVSSDWIRRNPVKQYDRPATIFGETHVTKNLRLAQASIFIIDEDEG